jgi:hypothetical protein
MVVFFPDELFTKDNSLSHPRASPKLHNGGHRARHNNLKGPAFAPARVFVVYHQHTTILGKLGQLMHAVDHDYVVAAGRMIGCGRLAW